MVVMGEPEPVSSKGTWEARHMHPAVGESLVSSGADGNGCPYPICCEVTGRPEVNHAACPDSAGRTAPVWDTQWIVHVTQGLSIPDKNQCGHWIQYALHWDFQQWWLWENQNLYLQRVHGKLDTCTQPWVKA